MKLRMHGPADNPPQIGGVMHSCARGVRRGYLVVAVRTVRAAPLGGACWSVVVEPRSIEQARAEIADGSPAWVFTWDPRPRRTAR